MGGRSDRCFGMSNCHTAACFIVGVRLLLFRRTLSKPDGSPRSVLEIRKEKLLILPTGQSSKANHLSRLRPLIIRAIVFLPPEADKGDSLFTGFVWIDANADGTRDADESSDEGRMITLFRCSEPWGSVGSAITDGNGAFSVSTKEAGLYQLDTPPPQAGFSPLGGDNDVFANGFANCTAAGSGNEIGIGVLP